MKLNLGCGKRKLDGWINVDAEVMASPDRVLDITTPWPWAADSVDEVLASHVLEHIAPGDSFFRVVKEMYRVCKPGAKVTAILPHPAHDVFLSDPTHVHAILPGTFALLSKRYVEASRARGAELTPFYKYLGVDFDIRTVKYTFDPAVNAEAGDIEWQAKHLRNIIVEWRTELTVVK